MPWTFKFYMWLNDPKTLTIGAMILAAMFGFSVAMAFLSIPK